ncbi:MAG TPA: hypothetical protein ENI77_02680, partial [Nitrospirae bacterium]|nr:hypothetical protein [Nitrospirota bacterium]
MRFLFTQFSIVVTAEQHNPTILNPDFLKFREIVPNDFEVSNVLVTAPLSQVAFNNDLIITVETNKMQVVKRLEGERGTNPETVKIAQLYVEALQHVHYEAVGINWLGEFHIEEPVKWIEKRFLSKGRWNDPPYGIQDSGVRMGFNVNGSKCMLNISCNHTPPRIMVSVNYHHDIIKKIPNYDEAVMLISKWEDKYSH